MILLLNCYSLSVLNKPSFAGKVTVSFFKVSNKSVLLTFKGISTWDMRNYENYNKTIQIMKITVEFRYVKKR